MILSITSRCLMECSHCLVNATPVGSDMSIPTFNAFLDFIKSAPKSCKFPIIVSGGEPTLNPLWFEFTTSLLESDFPTFLLSNGMFLDDDSQCQKLLSLKSKFTNFHIQITHDPKFYPKNINYKKAKSLNFQIIKNISVLIPLGRASNLNPVGKNYSPCANPKLVLLQRPEFSLWDIISTMSQSNKFCFPCVDHNGYIFAGESFAFCSKIGSIYDPQSHIINNIKSLTCNACKLDNGSSLLF